MSEKDKAVAKFCRKLFPVSPLPSFFAPHISAEPVQTTPTGGGGTEVKGPIMV